MRKVAVYGIGYVGAAYVNLLSKKNQIIAYDNDRYKIIEKRHNNCIDNVEYTTNLSDCYLAEIGLICISTNLKRNQALDTDGIFELTKKIHDNAPRQILIIKSTVPVGTTEKLIKKLKFRDLFFSPEFLRENHADFDLKSPFRIIIGGFGKNKKTVKNFFLSSVTNNCEVMFTSPSEAEAIKLFSNSYLAMRISFFNELDNFALVQNLSTSVIIKGVCLDKRIGNFYNSPSFGFGGYCLPKDTTELCREFEKSELTSNLLKGVIKSNSYRKDAIVSHIEDMKVNTVGIYNLETSNFIDFRYSPLLDIIKRLIKKNIDVIIYEENTSLTELENCKVYNQTTIKLFLERSDIILAGKNGEELNSLKKQVIFF